MSSTEEEMQIIKQRNRYMVKQRNRGAGISLEFLTLKYNELKVTLSGLRQFLPIESPLKMMINAFYFTSKALFILKIFRF